MKEKDGLNSHYEYLFYDIDYQISVTHIHCWIFYGEIAICTMALQIFWHEIRHLIKPKVKQKSGRIFLYFSFHCNEVMTFFELEIESL